MSDSLWDHGRYSPRNSPGQSTGVGSLSLLQRIFPTQGSNPGVPHCRRILYQLSHKGTPSILEWVAYPFSSGSSWPRDWIGVSWIAGRFFTNWAIRGDISVLLGHLKKQCCRYFQDIDLNNRYLINEVIYVFFEFQIFWFEFIAEWVLIYVCFSFTHCNFYFMMWMLHHLVSIYS